MCETNIEKQEDVYVAPAEEVKAALSAAFSSIGDNLHAEDFSKLWGSIEPYFYPGIDEDEIFNLVLYALMVNDYHDVAIAYNNMWRKNQAKSFIHDRLQYMDSYALPTMNAATASETDPNSNVGVKNVANLEGEVYKGMNRQIQRARMKKVLNEMYPDSGLGEKYIQDLENHICYTHDESTSPTSKYYCCAVTLYPLLTEGVGNIDGITPTPPNDIQSFSGQITNLVFLLSSQCKGAVAVGDYFIALNYYVIQEFGVDWYKRQNVIINTPECKNPMTIKKAIRKGMKQFIYGINQPAGNRSYNSPFVNCSVFDRFYFDAMFGEFCYPDATKPEWEAINQLQRIFMELHRELRLIKPLTFPVMTCAMLYDENGFKDKEYEELLAEEWSKGSIIFAYMNDNPTALASCCRVANEITDNAFSSTIGMTGVMTGSCNVITLNCNRIVQNFCKTHGSGYNAEWKAEFEKYFSEILSRFYKYHIAYKSILYDMEEKGMFAASNGSYIFMKKLYSTIGMIGYYEAAKFLGLETSVNSEYIDFLQLLFGTVKSQNAIRSIRDKKHPVLFNTEAIPGENLAVKFYEWDKADGYEVPEDQNLYNSYFYNPWDDTNVFDKLTLHGKGICQYTDGGQACHLNLSAWPSKQQCLQLMKVAREEGTNYWTMNVPVSVCRKCGKVVNAPIEKCSCGSDEIQYWVRIIGYPTPVDNWADPRKKEFLKRVYGNINI